MRAGEHVQKGSSSIRYDLTESSWQRHARGCAPPTECLIALGKGDEPTEYATRHRRSDLAFLPSARRADPVQPAPPCPHTHAGPREASEQGTAENFVGCNMRPAKGPIMHRCLEGGSRALPTESWSLPMDPGRVGSTDASTSPRTPRTWPRAVEASGRACHQATPPVDHAHEMLVARQGGS